MVLLDLGLPGISGYEVARRLRSQQSRQQVLRIIAPSGYGQPEDKAQSKDAGGDRHLVKPISIDEALDLIVSIWVPKRRYVEPRLAVIKVRAASAVPDAFRRPVLPKYRCC
ncbi:response regulator [Paraburkholderia sp. RL18-085-BIA-A]|uniref:response regulator n=1 Tax=Paraburkholderia sp. RL18-085-BIA-A TaxID=3031633 RepID=UPI0038B90A5F